MIVQSKKLITIGIAIVLLTACQSTNGDSSANAAWSGFLEGQTIDVSAQVSGRIVTIAVQEGDVVQAGQPLVTLDDEFVRWRIQAADANIAGAEAQLALLQAGARPEDLQRAQARVEQARLGLIAAAQAVTDTEAIRANPQALVIAQADAQTRALVATQLFTATLRQAEAADLEKNFWTDQNQSLDDGVDVRLPSGQVRHFDTPSARLAFARDQWNQAGNRAWQAWAAVETAKAGMSIAQNALQDISDQIANPIALDARVNQARAARDKAAASLLAAQAALQILRDGATPAQIQTARASLDQARAARATLDKELTHYQLNAPQAGTVLRVANRAGEIVGAATPIVRLSVGGELKLRVFVPIGQLEKIHSGDATNVFVGEANNRRFSGVITNIASQAEFSGRQTQTDSERNAQLIAVEIALTGADSQVKSGMPASAIFGNVSPPTALAAPIIVNQSESLKFSGTLEEKPTSVSSEMSGLVVAVRVDKGAAIQTGDALVELDDAAIKAALNEADAAVLAAQSNLDQVNEPARPGTLALAEAGISAAQADLKSANALLDNATRAIKSPQDLLTQIHLWEGKVLAAQGEAGRAEAVLAGVKSQVELAVNDQSVAGKMRLGIAQKQQEAAQAGLVAAQGTLKGNQRVLDLYKQMLAQPLELTAAQNSAHNQVDMATAGLQVAQTELDIAKRGPQKQVVALAQAKLRAAQVSQQIVQAQARRFVVVSPVDGRVIGRNVEPGETIRAGVSLITLADPRELEMTVYVPIRNVGAIKTGQSASLSMPSLSGKNFSALVSYIASEAEFKPANIYNSKERSEMVFAVRVRVPNPNEELKAGLPADVTFAP